MKNWKTTLSGLLAALGNILTPVFGVPQEISGAIVTLGVALLGYHAGDKINK